MRYLVPNLILQNYIAGNFQGEFTAVGLFVDIAGFSAITDSLMQHGQHGAEVLTRIMRRVFGPPSRSIYEQGGFIVGYAGDAFTALFPLGVDPNETYQRALAAAWAIQEHQAVVPVHSTEYGDFPISAKVGLAFGDAAWGVLRSRDGKQATYYFRGTAINGPAAAEHHAKAGEIILTENFYAVMQDKVEAEATGEYYRLVRLKGELPVAQPITLDSPSAQVMRAFYSEELLYQDLRSEFRQAINLFISLPELPTETLKTFLRQVFELQQMYGGLFTRVDYGDKGCNILLFWGAPVAHENDIDRALNFILGLKSRANFKFSAGVTYYISCAGFMGSEMMEEYTCYGWGINLAARLMLTAQRGEIWLDERVARRVEHRFDVEYVGEQNFKGFAQKQSVFVLRGRKDTPESFFQGAMVGRDSELRKLADFVSPLWKGEYAGSLTIWGDPGMGKSRLVHEFQSSPLISERKVFWGLCQADQILRESFNPFSYWLHRYFGVSESRSESLNKGNFESKLRVLMDSVPDPALAAELDHARSFLAALVDLHWPDSLYAKMDAQGRYDNTFIALTALIKAESLRQPFILIVEDAQYLDDDSSAFIQSLMRSLKADPTSYPVAIISTSRREGAALPLDKALYEQEIDLGGLTSFALAELAESILGNPPAVNLIQLLERRADGNPFFVEQILRFLQEESLLEMMDDSWNVAKRGQELTLPTDIKIILIARLDQLTREVKNVIQTASILGREFEIQVLASMLREDYLLHDEVHVAEQAAIWVAMSEIRYIFKHALLRDAAYTMQMQARRQELHTLAVEALETVFAGRLDSHFSELAYHAEQASLVEKARYYLEQAGDQARNAFQNTVAADYYTRALSISPIDDFDAQYHLRLWLNDVYDQIGDREAQKHNLEQLHQLALATNDFYKLAEVSNLETSRMENIGDFSHALEKAEETITLARQASANEIVVRAHVYILDVFYKQGKFSEVDAYAESGLTLARQIGFSSGEAQILNIYGLVALMQREPAIARERLERSLEIFEKENNLRRQEYPLSNLGMVASFQGDFAAAQHYYEKALSISREVGHRSGESLILQNLGWVLGVQGDYATAQTYLERSLRISRETGHRTSELYSLINISANAEILGEYDLAVRYAEQALSIAREITDRSGEAWALTYLGHGYFSSKMFTDAQTAYLGALELQTVLDQPTLATEPRAGLARVALGLGDLSVAQTHIDSILAHLDGGNSLDGTDQPLRVYLTCYMVLKALKNERAIPILETAHKILLDRANTISDSILQKKFLEDITFHREILNAWETESKN